MGVCEPGYELLSCGKRIRKNGLNFKIMNYFKMGSGANVNPIAEGTSKNLLQG